ncbi:DNA-3-methyladenine glycosylase 2 family protein [Gimesia aquarii]|uniref:Bifunctional transcriptional activator/DNA repair enzyme AdaA n=1 Tax=Gimesia aquarii TaxID=2527964 RepID=A0A517WYS3_9PLAN|nr:DNA-3-methyladenine glycosylase 2 family protein [Gimesia aquarii]QDU10406.1 Bifunctional transcriptional activator/DNA repair enzyme AdaA [Gimesia aquarii]
MNEEDIWYLAYQSRDQRFDGVFFLGVKSTSIYCRPICPAKTPKRENVRFFLTATAAEREGFRACKRCKPELAPLHFQSADIPEQIRRALHLIENGFLDEACIDSLAQQLGITARHLRRQFTRHLGISPKSWAQTRRLHLAKQLIEQTSLPLTRIAFDAGFQSIRTFNAHIKKDFGSTPTQIRNKASKESGIWSNIRLKITYRPPYPWHQVCQLLKNELLENVETLEDHVYSKLMKIEDEILLLKVRHLTLEHCFELSVSYQSLPGCNIRDLVTQTRLFTDVAANPLLLQQHFTNSTFEKRFQEGVRLVGTLSPFQMSVRSILQQSMKAELATKLMRAMCEKIELNSLPCSRLSFVFPHAEHLLERIRDLDIPPEQFGQIQNLCLAIINQKMNLSPVSDPFRLQNDLISLVGLSPKIATYIAIRSTGYPDLSFNRSDSFRPWSSYAFLAQHGFL